MLGPHFTESVDRKARSGCARGRFQFRAAPPAPAFSIPADGRKHRETPLLGRRVSGTVRLALRVADSEDMAAQLIAAGAEQVAPPIMTPWGDRNARVQAPDGMQLTLFTPE